MEYEQFVQDFTEKLQLNMENLGLKAELRREENMEKINGVQDILTVDFEGLQTSPVIYLKDVFEDLQAGMNMEDLARHNAGILRDFYEHPPLVPDMTEEMARSCIFSTVINADLNEEILQNIPHERVMDLAVIPKLRYGDGSMIVTDGLCQQLHLTGEEVMEIAEKNTAEKGFVCTDIREQLLGISAEELPAEEKGLMYVLSNPENMDGAIAMVSETALENACAEIGEAVYVLPSSRHEVLLIPESMAPDDVRELQEIVKTVNRTELNPKDFLSDNVYFFDGRALTMATEMAKAGTKEIAETVKNTIARS